MPIIYTFFSAIWFSLSIRSLIFLFSYINTLRGVNKLWAIELIKIFENFSVVLAFESLLYTDTSLNKKST